MSISYYKALKPPIPDLLEYEFNVRDLIFTAHTQELLM